MSVIVDQSKTPLSPSCVLAAAHGLSWNVGGRLRGRQRRGGRRETREAGSRRACKEPVTGGREGRQVDRLEEDGMSSVQEAVP